MSSAALEAQGMEVKIGNGASPEVFTAIPEIKTFSGPSGSAAVIDVTDLSSAAKEKRMGLADEGQLSFTINYIPSDTQHTALRAARAALTETNFKMVSTDTAKPVTKAEKLQVVLGLSSVNTILKFVSVRAARAARKAIC